MMRKLASMLLILGLLNPGMAAALGLGELTLKSFLNEPLVAEVALLETGDLDNEQLKVRLATREDFTRAGVDRAYFLTSLRFDVQDTAGGGSKLVITSQEPVLEPYLNFIVEVRWPTGRLLREYTVLLDPPVFVGGERGVSASRSASGDSQRNAAAEPSTASSDSRPTTATTRQYGANAAASPMAGEKYLVKRTDTLWRIANRGRPSDADVNQTMLDIERLNPEAFIGGNINRLKAGYVLRMPTNSDITTDPDEALQIVQRQMQRWKSSASQRGDRYDASEGLDARTIGGAESGEGHLQIAGADDLDDDYSGGDLSARMEDLDRARRDNSELEGRLDTVRDQVEMQQRLIALKDEQIAALQEALARAGAEPELEDPAVGQLEGAIEGAQDASEMGEEPIVEALPDPDLIDPEAAVDAGTEPEPTPVVETRPAPEPSIVDMAMEYLYYIVGGVAALVILLLVLLRNKFRLPGRGRGKEQDAVRGSADDEDEFAGVKLSADSLIVDEFNEDADGEGMSPLTSTSAPDEEVYAAQFETGDALAEADIYIAYGRFPQAVDLLKAAISVEPINTDYRMKLMEACVEMVDSAEFQQQYADLQVIGDQAALQRAASLLDAVDGGEVWLDDLPEPTLSGEDVAAAIESMESVMPPDAESELASADLGFDDETAELELDEDALDDLDADAGELDLDLEPEQAPEPEPDPYRAIEYDVDRDGEGADEETARADTRESDSLEDAAIEERLGADELDLDFPDLESDGETTEDGLDSFDFEDLDELGTDKSESDAPDTSSSAGDLELEDTGLESFSALDDDLDAEMADLGSTSEGDRDDLLGDLGDLDLGLDSADEAEPAEAGSEDLSELDLDDVDDGLLDLTADDEPVSLATSDNSIAAAPPELDDIAESELDGVDLELGELDEATDLENIELDMSAGDSEEGDDEGLLFAADGDEIATKLDLARAYIDMGDIEGARGILQEVVDGGNSGQQDEARALLEGID